MNKYIMPLILVVFFILFVAYTAKVAERIGFDKACKKMGLDTLTDNNGDLFCGDWDRLKMRYTNERSGLVLPDNFSVGIIPG